MKKLKCIFCGSTNVQLWFQHSDNDYDIFVICYKCDMKVTHPSVTTGEEMLQKYTKQKVSK